MRVLSSGSLQLLLHAFICTTTFVTRMHLYRFTSMPPRPPLLIFVYICAAVLALVIGQSLQVHALLELRRVYGAGAAAVEGEKVIAPPVSGDVAPASPHTAKGGVGGSETENSIFSDGAVMWIVEPDVHGASYLSAHPCPQVLNPTL